MAGPRHSEPSVVQTATEARGRLDAGVARSVLIFGTLLVVILFLIIFLAGRP